MDRRQILRLSEAASSEQPDYKEEGDLKYEQNVAYESVPKTLVNISKASEKAVDTVIGGIQDRQSEREKLKGSKQPGLFAKIDEKIEEVLEGLHGKYASSVPKETALRVRSGMCFQKSMEGRERKKGKKMKKLISLLLIVSLIPGIMCSCGKEKEIEESIEFPEDELLSEYRNAADLPMETVQDAGRAVAVYFYRGETKIYGEIYIPEGEGPFPVVIIAGGFATSHYGYQGMAQMFAENGIVGVVFDPSDTGYMGAMIEYPDARCGEARR